MSTTKADPVKDQAKSPESVIAGLGDLTKRKCDREWGGNFPPGAPDKDGHCSPPAVSLDAFRKAWRKALYPKKPEAPKAE